MSKPLISHDIEEVLFYLSESVLNYESYYLVWICLLSANYHDFHNYSFPFHCILTILLLLIPPFNTYNTPFPFYPLCMVHVLNPKERKSGKVGISLVSAFHSSPSLLYFFFYPFSVELFFSLITGDIQHLDKKK